MCLENRFTPWLPHGLKSNQRVTDDLLKKVPYKTLDLFKPDQWLDLFLDDSADKSRAPSVVELGIR